MRVGITVCHFRGLLIRYEPTFVHILLHGESYIKEHIHFRFKYQSILVSTHGFPLERCLLGISCKTWNPSPVFPMLSSTVVPVLPSTVVPVLPSFDVLALLPRCSCASLPRFPNASHRHCPCASLPLVPMLASLAFSGHHVRKLPSRARM